MTRNSDIQRKAYVAPQMTKFGSVRALTGGSLDVGEDAPFPTGKNVQSDMRVKESIARVGEHPAGFGLYLFDYKPEFQSPDKHGRQFGVMAQEVERVVPDAVSIGPDGYRQVDYAKLGIQLH